MKFVLDLEYKRTDIHDALGGSRQCGISPIKETQQVLLFSHTDSDSHGYQDFWKGDVFYYSGAGQKGDQDPESNRHNGKVFNHIENGDTLHLFEETRKGYCRYTAELELKDFEFFQSKDAFGNIRTAVRFLLQRLEQPQSAAQPTLNKNFGTARQAFEALQCSSLDEKKAIDEYLFFNQKIEGTSMTNKPKKAPFDRTAFTTISIPNDVYAKLKQMADEDDRKISRQLTRYINEFYDRRYRALGDNEDVDSAVREPRLVSASTRS